MGREESVMRRSFAHLCLLLGLTIATPGSAAEYLAFLVGIDKYEHLRQLDSAKRDMKSVYDTLASQDINFAEHSITALPDATRTAFLGAWYDVLQKVGKMKDGGVLIFYYAGHGVELDGENFLLPKDLPAFDRNDQTRLRQSAIRLQEDILLKFGGQQATLADKNVIGIFIIDACRDDPYEFGARTGADEERVRDSSHFGLAPLAPPSSVFVMYSAGIGQQALDGGPNNTVFLSALLPLLRARDPRLDLAEIAQRVKFKVYQAALAQRHVQTPAYYDQLLYRQDIIGQRAGTDVIVATSDSFAAVPRSVSNDLRPHDEILECKFCPQLVVIPPGKVGGEGTGIAEIKLNQPLAVARHEVTNLQWNACVDLRGPCKGKRDAAKEGERPQEPVSNVSWQEATDFSKWLSTIITKELQEKDPDHPAVTYRLPTEKEWEYAARAGTTTAYAFGDEVRKLCQFANGADQSVGSLAWVNYTCNDGFGRRVAPVGSFKPNDWKLHDMHGNVWEWVCAVTRRRFPVGARPTRRFAPAGSNRSSHGGNEMAEAFD
jgi:formylglycine-generating enzyme required for sulfatase activity